MSLFMQMQWKWFVCLTVPSHRTEYKNNILPTASMVCVTLYVFLSKGQTCFIVNIVKQSNGLLCLLWWNAERCLNDICFQGCVVIVPKVLSCWNHHQKAIGLYWSCLSRRPALYLLKCSTVEVLAAAESSVGLGRFSVDVTDGYRLDL